MATPPQQTFAVMLVGFKKPVYFEAEGWQSKDDVLVLSRGDNVVAMFPLRNVIALIDLNAGAHVTGEKAKENLKNSGLSKPDLELSLHSLGSQMA
jgi:hypothetical protein